MNNLKLTTLTLCISLATVGCASSPEPSDDFNAALYSGKPIDSLSSDAPPSTEKEAIMRGDVALREQNLDLALYEYIRSLSYPEKQYHDKTLMTIGQIHVARQNDQLAEKAFLASIENNPENAAAMAELGLLYSKQGRMNDAKKYFVQAINQDQKRLNSSTTVSDSNSIETIRSLAIDSSSPAVAYMGLGVFSDVKRKHDIAQEFFKKCLEANPTSIKGLVNMGYSRYMSGDYASAKRVTATALQYDPDNERAINNLALIYLARGESQRALSLFKRQMSDAEALNNVGYFLMLQGKPDEAIPYLQQAIDKKPSYYKVANENLARALTEVRKKDKPAAW
ncbi:TPA: tetratricopeptide repeat protein [Vibrio harveyi]|nr:tetratricopeptide repeat protein [Vibrio harveyi]